MRTGRYHHTVYSVAKAVGSKNETALLQLRLRARVGGQFGCRHTRWAANIRWVVKSSVKLREIRNATIASKSACCLFTDLIAIVNGLCLVVNK